MRHFIPLALIFTAFNAFSTLAQGQVRPAVTGASQGGVPGPATTGPASRVELASGWRRPDKGTAAPGGITSVASRPAVAPTAATNPLTPTPGALASRAPVRQQVSVVEGSGRLPSDHGQIWREYDITPYTKNITTSDNPQQAVIDWVLRETGTEVWFRSPVGLLSADRQKLRVYHTPQMQSKVRDIVERFVANPVTVRSYGIRLMTIANPNWRLKMQRNLQPIPTRTQGVEAWILSKEDAARLLTDLRKRSDYREHHTSTVPIFNGQVQDIASRRPRMYNRAIVPRSDVAAGFQLDTAQAADEFSMELSPLLSADERTVDTDVRCRVAQIERMVQLDTSVPTAAGTSQAVQLHMPQTVERTLHERIRWPADKVLIISGGMVPLPETGKATAIGFANPFDIGPARANALFAIEYLGSVPAPQGPQPRAASVPSNSFNRGRY